MATTEGQQPGYTSGNLDFLDDLQEKVLEGDKPASAFVRAYLLFGIGLPVLKDGSPDFDEHSIILEDRTEVRIGVVLGKGEMVSVGVSKDGSEIVGFSLNSEGLYAINTGESYVTRTSFLGTEFEDSGVDEDFKGLSLPVVNWLGVSIFSEKLQPFPEDVTSAIQKIASLIK